MRWKRGASERGYHHGNLKEALIRAALDLIREKGPAGFTFADAARFAGVSPAAPYRHYRDRDDLLSDVAKRGFEEFEQRLSKAWDDGKPEPRAAFERLGKAYLAFARDEPAFYSAMFEAGLPQDISPELRAAGDRAFAVVRRACETVSALLPADETATGIDDGAAHLGVLARHCLSVRTRRWRKKIAANVGRGPVGGGGACLSERSWSARESLTGTRRRGLTATGGTVM